MNATVSPYRCILKAYFGGTHCYAMLTVWGGTGHVSFLRGAHSVLGEMGLCREGDNSDNQYLGRLF